MRIAATYAVTLIVLCLADFLWLGFVTKDFVRAQVGPVLLDAPRWIPAALFYAMYATGVLYFVVLPAAATGSWQQAAMRGALFGLFCYGTYDLTNLATLKSWTLPLTMVDIAWGTLVTAVMGSAGTLVAQRMA